jgi:3-hydroxybutyryl-CoA dehydrogenase
LDIKTIAIVGGGAMGNGIAQVAATAGYQVILRDISDVAIERAMATLRKSLERVVKAGKLSDAEFSATLGRIQSTTRLEDVASADYVIEAIPEVLTLKQELFKTLDGLCRPEVILASNTSELSVTAIAAATGRGDRVIGMHWFNPPPVMKLVEIVRGVRTSDDTLRTTEAISHRMGKETVVCKDAQGFITSRALCALLTECYRIAEEGLASYEDIDKAIRLGLNHPMGPLELSDYVGMDVLVHASEGMVEAYGDRFRMPQSVIKQVEAGHFGRKSGRGFYDYSKKDAANLKG